MARRRKRRTWPSGSSRPPTACSALRPALRVRRKRRRRRPAELLPRGRGAPAGRSSASDPEAGAVAGAVAALPPRPRTARRRCSLQACRTRFTRRCSRTHRSRMPLISRGPLPWRRARRVLQRASSTTSPADTCQALGPRAAARPRRAKSIPPSTSTRTSGMPPGFSMLRCQTPTPMRKPARPRTPDECRKGMLRIISGSRLQGASWLPGDSLRVVVRASVPCPFPIPLWRDFPGQESYGVMSLRDCVGAYAKEK
mmetsp:Transcript_19370/g.73240  ORF Transcript_19370/g.73240 Transcript_19370/m.73240 type:complete len:255 (+) Transcript_19370:230-994(+)